MFLTRNKDSENILFDYLDLKSIFKYILLSKWHYNFIKNKPLYLQLKEYDRSLFLADWASKKGYCDILIRLLYSNPNFKYYDALGEAAYHGHFDILEWFEKNINTNNIHNCSLIISENAAKRGRMDILEWLNTSKYGPLKYNQRAIDAAAANGHIEILELFKNLYSEMTISEIALSRALEKNYLGVLIWYSKFETVCLYYTSIDKAILNKYFEAIEWLYVYRIRIHPSSRVIETFARNGDLDMLTYLEKFVRMTNYPDAVLIAAEEGHLNILKLFYSRNNNSVNKNVIERVCKCGHKHILEWMKPVLHKYNFIKTCIEAASEGGCVNILDWFFLNKYQFNFSKSFIKAASKNGHVNVLMYFRKIGYNYAYDEMYVQIASENGKVNVLNYFKQLGWRFVYVKNSVLLASQKGHINVLDWFKINGYGFENDLVKLKAILLNCSPEVRQWFDDSCVFDPKT